MHALWVSLKENVNCRSRAADVVVRLEKNHDDETVCNPGKEYLDSKLCSRLRRNSFGEVTFSLYHTHLQLFVANVNCRSQVKDVVIRREKFGSRRSCNLDGDKLDAKLIHQGRHSLGQVIIRRCNPGTTHYKELSIGDPTRNIIALIFQRSLTNQSKSLRNLKRILKVRNSLENLERFEIYREKVKKNAHEHLRGDPRSVVDGNELLRFFGTTVSCCCRNSRRISQLCRDPACRACRIIQANFDAESTGTNGIRMSTDSEEMTDDMIIALSKRKKVERAVIVCRVIAGMVDSKLDRMYEECKSVGRTSLIVRNPCAVLPCFVIVFS